MVALASSCSNVKIFCKAHTQMLVMSTLNGRDFHGCEFLVDDMTCMLRHSSAYACMRYCEISQVWWWWKSTQMDQCQPHEASPLPRRRCAECHDEEWSLPSQRHLRPSNPSYMQ
jgi:hypothetical protein